MNYDEFNTEYAKVLDKIKSGRCSWSELSGHVTRLRQATAGITVPVERTQVDHDLAALSQMVDMSRRTNDKEDVWTVTSEAIRSIVGKSLPKGSAPMSASPDIFSNKRGYLRDI